MSTNGAGPSARWAAGAPLPATPVWFLARCKECGGWAQPFEVEAERDQWAGAHVAATGHVVNTSCEGQIVYVTIGNSDDHLPQARWSQFVQAVQNVLQASIDRRSGNTLSGAWVGSWRSESAAPWQNACWCVEYFDAAAAGWAQTQLMILAAEYGQTEIAWSYGVTVMIGPAGVAVASVRGAG